MDKVFFHGSQVCFVGLDFGSSVITPCLNRDTYYMSNSPLSDSSTFVTLKDKIRGGEGTLGWAGFGGFSLVLWIICKNSTCIQPIYYSG